MAGPLSYPEMPMSEDLWNAMLDADMNARCWASMTRIYSRIDLGTRIFLGITSSGAVAGWAMEAAPGVWKTFSVLSAIVAVASPIFNFPKSIRGLSDMAGKWQLLHNDYEELWRNDRDMGDRSTKKRFDELKRAEAKHKVNETGLPVFKRVLNASAEAVKCSRGLQ